METKNLTFTVYQLIVGEGAPYNVNSFSSIGENELKPFQITNSANVQETLSLLQMQKQVIDDRFLLFSFKKGDKWPYPPTVIDSSLTEHDNPRSADEIELNDQYFIFIDTRTQKVYFSNGKKKIEFTNWLEEKTGQRVTIKAVLNQEEFIGRLRSIDELSFAVTPNLVTNASENTLTRALTENILGFGAEKAILKFDFHNATVTDQIKTKLQSIFRLKHEFEDLTLIGYSDDRLESILNVEGIINRFTVRVQIDSSSRLIDPEVVKVALVQAITSNP